LTADALHGTVFSNLTSHALINKGNPMAEEQQKIQKTSSDKKDTPKRGMQHPVVYAISIFVLVIIAITFVAGPSLNMFSPQAGDNSFGSIYGTTIEYTPGSYFAQQQQSLAQEFSQSGQEVNIQTIYQIWRVAFQRTLLHYALLEKADQGGFAVSQEAVDKAMAQNPRFFENGTFSAEKYRSVSNVERLQLRETTHENLIHQGMIEDILLANELSDAESSFIAQMGLERRSFNLARFSFADYPASEVVAFTEANPADFRVRELSSITLASEAEAQALLDRIKNSEINFTDAALEYSVDAYAEQGGIRGTVIFFDFQSEFNNEADAEAAFTLATGEVSEVYETRNGRFGIFTPQTDLRQISAEQNAEIQRVRSYISRFEPQRIEEYFKGEAETFILAAQSQGFDQAAQQRGISTITTNEFPINYGSVALFPTARDGDGNQISGTSTNKEFYQELFSLGEEEISTAIMVGNQIVVGQLNSSSEADTEELEYLESFAGYIIQDWLGRELERVYLDPTTYDDRFDDAFQRLVMGN
jgi:parvulin-like peptidyl-prolyl isomerase